jgi:hypothetical protein
MRQIFSSFLVFLFLLAPVGLFSSLFFGWEGVGITLAGILLFFLRLWSRAETLLIHSLCSTPLAEFFSKPAFQGLHEKGSHHPKIHVFPDPVPSYFIAKGLFSSGKIFLSQGLLIALNQKQFESLIEEASIRLTQHRVSLLTFLCTLIYCVARRIPEEWFEVFSPTGKMLINDDVRVQRHRKEMKFRGVVWFLILTPLLQFLFILIRVNETKLTKREINLSQFRKYWLKKSRIYIAWKPLEGSVRGD